MLMVLFKLHFYFVILRYMSDIYPPTFKPRLLSSACSGPEEGIATWKIYYFESTWKLVL